MKFDDVKKDAASRSNYAKLEKDIPSRVKFLSDDFEKVEKTFEGKLNVKYEVPCIINGQRKIFSGSAKLYEKCMVKANNRNKGFTELTYIITKTGEGLKTEYDVDVVDSIVGDDIDTSDVPF